MVDVKRLLNRSGLAQRVLGLSISAQRPDGGGHNQGLLNTITVYTMFVKNITLSADEHLIELARNKAREQHTTLNAAFREWLVQFTAQQDRAKEYDELMRRLRHVKAGRHFSRDELNER